MTIDSSALRVRSFESIWAGAAPSPSVTWLVTPPKKKELPPALARVGYAVQRALGAIGSGIAGATDEEDLVARIDRVLEIGLLHEQMEKIAKEARAAFKEDPELLLAKVAKAPSLSSALADKRAARAVIEAESLSAESLRLLKRLSASPKPRTGVGARSSPLLATPGPMGFLADAPVPVARVILTQLRGSAAMFGLMWTIANRQRVATWLVRSLAGKYRDGENASLCLLLSCAKVSGFDVSSDLVAESDLLDLQTVAAAHRRTEKWVLERAKEAAESGTDCG